MIRVLRRLVDLCIRSRPQSDPCARSHSSQMLFLSVTTPPLPKATTWKPLTCRSMVGAAAASLKSLTHFVVV